MLEGELVLLQLYKSGVPTMFCRNRDSSMGQALIYQGDGPGF